MKKKIVISALIIGASLLGVFSLNAANNRIQIVSENYASKQLSNDGMHITNMINKSKTDLVKGDVAIEIVIDNAKHTEVFYVVDNGKTMSSIKGNVLDSIKTNAKSLEELENVKQGIVTTTDGNISLVPLDTENIEMQLDTLKSSASSTTTDGEIFDSIDKAVENFSTEADVKVIVVALSTMPTLNADEASALKTKMDQYATSGIKLIVYGINLADTTNFTNIFDAATKYELANNELEKITYLSNIMAYLPQEKPAISTTVSFDNYILSNFDIKDITTDFGVVRYDSSTNMVIWEAGNIGTNDTVKLTYTLSLKKAVDESIVETLTLRTNRQIIVRQSGTAIGTFPSDNQIDDQICSPTIKVLREAIDNPKTGVANYIIFGSCMLAIAAITIVILNSKNEFNRI